MELRKMEIVNAKVVFSLLLEIRLDVHGIAFYNFLHFM